MTKHVTPESQGIPSSSLISLIKKLDHLKLPMHSLIISRHKQIVLETYYAPFKEDTLHRMFSISKSFTSIAIGQLEFEGYLSLSDPVAQYFKDMIPIDVHPFIMEMTIKDLLKMTTCHTKTTYKDTPNQNWVKSFFTTEPSHRPGTVFNYDTSASHTLAALVERLTGKSLLEYLRDVCLNQIDFSQDAYMLKDPFNVSMGGSGLMAKPMDLMVFAQLLMAHGTYQGKSLLAKPYLQAATSQQSETQLHGSFPETREGYGYQFWQNSKNGYSCFGMGGQLIICLPEYDLVVVTTADTQGMNGGDQLIYLSLYEALLPYLSPQELEENPMTQLQLRTLAQSCQVKPVSSSLNASNTSFVNGQFYSISTNPEGFERFSLEIDASKTTGTLKYLLAGRWHDIAFGIDHMILSQFPIYNQKCMTSGAWIERNTFLIKSHIIDECLGAVNWQLTFHPKGLSIFMKSIEETSFSEYNGYLEGNIIL